MNAINIKQVVLSLVILLALLVVVTSVGTNSVISTNDILSIELGVASFSPSGVSGGAVIPASCGSPHAGDLCTPPNFNGNNGYGGESGGGSGGGSGSNIFIINGNSATLEWECVGLSSSSGINFSTGGEASGTASVSPTSTARYTVLCSNGGQSSVTVTVIYPELSITATPPMIQSGDTSTIEWSATSVNSCTISEDNLSIVDSWVSIGDSSGRTSGTQTTSQIEEETIYTLSCETDGGPTTETVTVRLIPVFQEF